VYFIENLRVRLRDSGWFQHALHLSHHHFNGLNVLAAARDDDIDSAVEALQHLANGRTVGGLDKDGKPEDNFTPEQYRALGMLLKNWRMVFPRVRDVCGHRDLSPDVDNDGVIEPWEWLKACPCFDVRAWRLRTLPDLFDQGGLRGPDNLT